MIGLNEIYLGDCLEVMGDIDDQSIDMILCDLPYGTTACHWDSRIPLEPLWAHYKRVIKPRGAIVLTASQPFTTLLINAGGLDWFKYSWVWDKVISSGMSYARHRPMAQSEDICVFGKGRLIYNPQVDKRKKPIKSGGANFSASAPISKKDRNFSKMYDVKMPSTILSFMKVRHQSLHPTQKPVPLFAYFIRTYTHSGQLVLDNCIGSGTTAIAAIETGRQWIGIEKDPEYYELAKQRIADRLKQPFLPGIVEPLPKPSQMELAYDK